MTKSENRYRVSYAQNREDIILNGFFGPDEVGFYVDVGAEDPNELSVTKLFYEKGWHGINIEPIAEQYKLFVEERPRDINLNIGVSNQQGTLTFREYKGTGYSTFSDEMKAEYKGSSINSLSDFKDYDVKVMTLRQIFDKHKVKSIQFLKVDVEGLEYEVLDGNDWVKYRPEVICIEANHVKKNWRELLKKKNYTSVFHDGLNEYYCDRNTDRAKKFDYVDTIIYHEPLIEARIDRELQRYERHINWLEKSMDSIREDNDELSARLKLTQDELNRSNTLNKLFKKRAKNGLHKLDRKIVSKLSNTESFNPLNEPLNYGGKSNNELIDMAKNYDQDNFQLYVNYRQRRVLLPIYRSSKGVAVKSFRRAKSLMRSKQR